MKYTKNMGIVLKTYSPHRQKLSLFDAQLGKIVGVPNRHHISHGSLLSYHVQEQPNIYWLHTIDIVNMPCALAQDDILFVHHVLELCYYFVPVGSAPDRLFNLLMALYVKTYFLKDALLKKLFVFQLFASLGLYPEGEQFQSPLFYLLASASIDILADQKIDLEVEHTIDNWLMSCVSLHPYIDNFKTIDFLRINRAL